MILSYIKWFFFSLSDQIQLWIAHLYADGETGMMWWQIIWLRGREQEALCLLIWAARSRTYIEWVSEWGMDVWEGGGRVDGGASIWARAVTHMAACYTIVLLQMKERKLPKKAERVQPPWCFYGAASLQAHRRSALISCELNISERELNISSKMQNNAKKILFCIFKTVKKKTTQNGLSILLQP